MYTKSLQQATFFSDDTTTQPKYPVRPNIRSGKIHAFFLGSRNAKKNVPNLLTTHIQLETVRVSTITFKS